MTKQSGIGRRLGEESIEAHTQVKSIVVRFSPAKVKSAVPTKRDG